MSRKNDLADIIGMALKRSNKDDGTPNHIILLNFCVGGLINYLRRIAENNFPIDPIEWRI